MAKRKQRKAEPGEEAEEQAAAHKRRRAVRSRPAQQEGAGEAEVAAPRRPGALAPAEAASGRAESDDDDSSSAPGSAPSSGSDTEEYTAQDSGHQQASRGAAGQNKHLRGVRIAKRMGGKAFRARATGMPPEVVAAMGTRRSGSAWNLELGTHKTQEAAARVHDRALIAVLGRKAAVERGLNFPLGDYPEAAERQRFGPDLHAYLLALRAEGGVFAPGRPPKKQRQGLQEDAAQQRLKNLEKARDIRLAKSGSSRRAEALVAEHRRADPLVAPRKPCGVCPACRQPWRTDLGVCARLAAFKAAGYREREVVRRLAAIPEYVAALEAEKLRQEAERDKAEGPRAAAGAAGRQQQQRQQQQQQQGRGATPRQASPAPLAHSRPERELEWLEQPAQATVAGRQALDRLRRDAQAPLRQQLAWDQAAFGAALAAEQQLAAPAAAVGAAPSPAKGRRRRAASTAATAAGSGASPAGALAAAAQQLVAEPALIDPFTWRAKAEPPGNVIHVSPNPQELVQLAALCRQGGAQVPLSVDQAQQLLEGEEARQEALARRLARWRRRQAGDELDEDAEVEEAASSWQLGEDGDAGSVAGMDGLRADSAGPGSREGSPAGTAAACALCGGGRHGQAGLRGCPVAQMALALPKQEPECPGCAHQEQPGCQRCIGTSKASPSAGLVRRAPWLDQLAPATKQLMLAAQEVSSAAIADLGAPAAAWRCTPKALLAVGLLAEEAARMEVATRLSD